MMKIRKTRVSMAVGAALGIAVLAPATAFGVSYDVGHHSQLPAIESDSGGDALLFPIYSTAKGATTSFSVTNTSSDEVAAIKIRFREQEHSMDVLDFIAVLSPEDKFDFWVKQGENGRPVMSWNDNSCVVGPAGTSVEFPAPNAPFVTSDEQMAVGHLEVLGTRDLSEVCWDGSDGWTSSSSCPSGYSNVGNWAIHGPDGVPANCAGLEDILSDPSKTLYVYKNSDSLSNVLLGRYVVTAGADGVEAGGDALEIEDTDLGLYAQSNVTCGNKGGSGNCYSAYAWDTHEWDHPHLAQVAGLRGLQALTGADKVAGDWSNNPANHVGVDWVLTFFSKYAYLDYVARSACNDEGSAKAWCLLSTTRTGNGIPQTWVEQSTTNTCLVDNSIEVWDTEEGKATGNVNVSPGTRETLDLCNEVNVLTFAADGTSPRDSLIQTNDRRQVLGFKNLDALRGWAAMELSFYGGPGYLYDYAAGSLGGLIFTTRATDDPNHNNGSITEIKKLETLCGGELEIGCLDRD